MDMAMERYQEVEQSFKQIRISTGNADVQEMVHKFLTREQTYATLLTAVSENEKKLEDLRQANEEKVDELHSLKINNEADSGANKAARSEEDMEILALQDEIRDMEKDLSIVRDRK
jgi:hypothetical protein